MHRFREPNAVRVDLRDCLPRPAPKRKRHKRRHVAAESVHDSRPHNKRIDEVFPQTRRAVIQIDHIRPIPHLVAGLAVRVVIKVFRMLHIQRRIRRSMVIHNIDHALHSVRMDLLHKRPEVRHCAVSGIHASIVAVRVGAAERPLLPRNADGMDRHQPNNIRSKRTDAVKIVRNSAKCPFRRVIADVNGINDLVLQSRIGLKRHICFPPVQTSVLTLSHPYQIASASQCGFFTRTSAGGRSGPPLGTVPDPAYNSGSAF